MDVIIVSIYDGGFGGGDVWTKIETEEYNKFLIGQYMRAEDKTLWNVVDTCVRGNESDIFSVFDILVGLSERSVTAIVCEDGGIDVYKRIKGVWRKEIVK